VSVQEHYVAGCFGKETLTRELAHKVAKRMARNPIKRGVEPYKCPFCKRWHVGKPSL
jgi:hypothetical protein